MSNIEEDIKKLNKYIELVIDKDYCDCNELNVICGKHCDGSKNVAYAVKKLLAEREEDKKKIEELEEKNQHLSSVSDYETISLQNNFLEEQLELANSQIEELEDRCKSHQKLLYMAAEVEKNSIPKQKVKDKFNKLITRIKEFKNPEIKKYFSIEQIIYLLEQFENKLLEDK